MYCANTALCEEPEVLDSAMIKSLWMDELPVMTKDELYHAAARALAELSRIASDVGAMPGEKISDAVARKTKERVEWMRQACIDRITNGVNP